jgi:hypothetical protein
MYFDFFYIFCLKRFQNFANSPKRRLSSGILFLAVKGKVTILNAVRRLFANLIAIQKGLFLRRVYVSEYLVVNRIVKRVMFEWFKLT